MAKFLGIWLDNRLRFEKQIKEIRGKVEKANSILKYLAGISRGLEVNMTLMLYKSLIRSIIDYGIFVFYPTTSALALKLERAQFLGIRTALGYRNSTPNNVIIAEAKVIHLIDRARMLAKNFCGKIYKYGEQSIQDSIDKLLHRENYARYKNPINRQSIISEAWNRFKQVRKSFGASEYSFEIWNLKYETITNKIEIDLEFGAQLESSYKNRMQTKTSILDGYTRK